LRRAEQPLPVPESTSVATDLDLISPLKAILDVRVRCGVESGSAAAGSSRVAPESLLESRP